ncbi:HD domain-containing protein [Marinobacterium lacunae]|uniref:HD domain-containing protein n=1 Tax=Marinobacterium lacunae TaxID=1232683 RepID=UPI0018CC0EFB|nr:HD domain-containing protein [Marinobacterium lacunae]
MNQPSAVALTTSKPDPGLCFLIRQFAAGDIRELLRKTSARLSGRRPPYVAPADYHVPDSAACKKAISLVREASPDFLFGHCMRTHAFAVAMGHKVSKPVDREVLFLGCIMHDLGLTAAHDHGGTFELDGAKAAHHVCVSEGLSPDRADLVHEMVALHNSVGVAEYRQPEVALVHYGAGADVIGMWVHDIDPKTLHEILEQQPRDGFGEGMARLIEDQVTRKPDSYMASMVRMGFLKKLRSANLG